MTRLSPPGIHLFSGFGRPLIPCPTRKRSHTYLLPFPPASHQTNGVFEMHIKKGGEELVYTIDLKKEGEAYEGKAKGKADVTINTSDESEQRISLLSLLSTFC